MSIEQAFELAGFFAAHGIWCVSDSEVLIPFLGSLTADRTRRVDRFVANELSDAVARGRAAFDASSDPIAILVYDTLITLPDGKTDAVTLDISMHGPTRVSASMAIPYRNASDPLGFAVFRPKFLTLPQPQPQLESLAEAFFRGVEQHEQGAKIWNEKIDQSR
jgi:hypothetical protein